jgi:hypothetical protein
LAGIKMAARLDTAPAEPSVYRCADCGHGRKLWAYAYACVSGPLGADGVLSEHQSVDTTEDPIEASIQCTRHPGSVIEMSVNGEWCRVWNCPECNGYGYIRRGGTFNGDKSACRAAGYKGRHSCWRPVTETAAVTAGEDT